MALAMRRSRRQGRRPLVIVLDEEVTPTGPLRMVKVGSYCPGAVAAGAFTPGAVRAAGYSPGLGASAGQP